MTNGITQTKKNREKSRAASPSSCGIGHKKISLPRSYDTPEIIRDVFNRYIICGSFCNAVCTVIGKSCTRSYRIAPKNRDERFKSHFLNSCRIHPNLEQFAQFMAKYTRKIEKKNENYITSVKFASGMKPHKISSQDTALRKFWSSKSFYIISKYELSNSFFSSSTSKRKNVHNSAFPGSKKYQD